MNWHTKDLKEVFNILKSSPEGINLSKAISRREKYGYNKLPEPKTDNLFLIFLRQFKSPLIYILLCAAVILLFIGDFSDVLVIFIVLISNAIIGTLQEGRAQNTLLALRKFTETNAVVLRAGKEIIIPDYELVPGDIILLQEGQKVPADARLIEVNNLKTNEAPLTGESEPISKITSPLQNEDILLADQKNMIFRGTYIVSGSGKAIVTAIGSETVIGKISSEIAKIDTEIPLKKDIRKLSAMIILLSFFISSAIFIAGILFFNNSIIDMFKLIVALAVSFIPEGLPVVLTIILATGVSRMARKNALVKKLQAVEALGRTKVIAIDKTGTLTTNEMIVKKAFVGGKMFEIDGLGYDPSGNFYLVTKGKKNIISPENFPDLLIAGKISAFSGSAKIKILDKHAIKQQMPSVIESFSNHWAISGDPTEASMIVFAQKMGFKRDIMLQHYPLIKEIPFNFKTKYHATVNKIGDKNMLSVVGVPEVVLNFCNKVLWEGQEISLNKEIKYQLTKSLKSLLNRGLRTIALGFNDDIKVKDLSLEEMPPLTFVGFLGMVDPLREGVKEVLNKIKSAGIKIVMITGDHKITARAIAKEAGIYKVGDYILTGEQIDKMNQKELIKLMTKTTVYARVTPEHKLKIINYFRKMGYTIAMTGDGVNDTPSLVAADLGVAMGKIGTEVAKEAGDIVLLDDKLESIVAAIEEGRNIFLTIKKTLQYLLSTNIAEVFTITFSLFFMRGHYLPLSPSQIIWLNFITDGFLVAALAMEPKEKGLLKKYLRKRGESFFNNYDMIRMILTAFVITLGSVFIFWLHSQNNNSAAQSATLTTLAIFQWFRAWEAKSYYKSLFQINLTDNKFLIGATLIIVFLQLLAIYNPIFQKILKTVPLGLKDWVLIIFVSSSIIIFEELRKIYDKKKIKISSSI